MNALRKTLQLAAIVLASALSLTACGGGGGGGSAGQSVAGATTGEITGFGSVIVNGIEFSRKTGLADDKVQLKFEGLQNQTEDKLKAGMVVKITGTFNSVTGKGEYEAIEFQPELRGRLDDNGVDLVNDKIKIMGREVQIEANTQFDSLRDLAELKIRAPPMLTTLKWKSAAILTTTVSCMPPGSQRKPSTSATAAWPS